jgi:DNA-binding GntR family transcriptional regulator
MPRIVCILLPRLDTTTASLAADLRGRILDARLAPGSELRQDEIARDLGVSRTPLREALRLLEGEGLVESHAHRSMVVAPISADELEEIYAMRVALEATAIRVTVPTLGPADLAPLRGLLAEMEFHADRRDLAAWEEPHERFHARLTAAAGGSYAERCAALRRASRRYRRAYLDAENARWEQAAAEHRGIASACDAGHQEEAAARLAAHLAGTALALLAEVDPDREPLLLQAAVEHA